jgi:aminoglycoside phosphotransferase (APT) family kinase protein
VFVPASGSEQTLPPSRRTETRAVRPELAWALRQLGPAAELVRVRRIPANPNVRMYDLVVHNRGARRRLVLRRYPDSEWIRREGDLVAREAATLQVLAGAPCLRTPALVAVDADGAASGAPTLLMTHLGGRAEWKPPSIEQLAEVAPLIHQVKAPRNFRRYRRYFTGEALVVPSWSRQPKLWERAFEVAESARVDESTACFIHRDHHQGNVLWYYGRVHGVIDWEPASIGPPAVDYARMRMNLAAQMGISAARRYARCPGIEADPVWDVVDAVDCGGGTLPGRHGRNGLEAFVADALSELGLRP